MGTVSSCCCAFTLEQGTIATGVYCLIDAIITFATGIWALKYSHSLKHHSYNLYRTDYVNYGVAALIFSIMGIVSTIFLFIGVNKKQRGFIIPFIVMYGIILVAGIPTLIFLTSNVSGNVTLTVAQAIGFSLLIYLYIVVISYYKSYERQPVYNTPYNQPGFVVPPNTGYYTTGEVRYVNTYTKQPDNSSTHLPAELQHTPGAAAYMAKLNSNVSSNYPSDPPPYSNTA